MMITWFVFTVLSLGKVSQSAIVTEYPEVAQSYSQLRNENSGHDDPLQAYTDAQRQKACAELTEARRYEAISEETSFPGLIELDDTTQFNVQEQNPDLKEEYREIYYPPYDPNVTVMGFMCVLHPKFTWYLSYGFKENYKFVLERSHENTVTGIYMIGQLEPTPSIDSQLIAPYYPKKLEKLFLENVNAARHLSNPPVSQVCSLNDANKQFRLCSLAHDAYNQVDNFQDRRSKNFVKPRRNECSELTITLTSKYEENQNKNQIQVNALPCAVNQEWNASPHLLFYLTADPRNANAAFAIRYNLLKREYYLLAHVKDIVDL